MPTLVYSLRKIYRHVSRVLESKLAGYDLTLPQWHFLTEIANADGLGQSDLTDRVGVSPSTTVSALRVLERRGFVRREQDSNDARSFRIYITPEGKRLRKGVRPVLLEVDRIIVAGLSDVETGQLHSTLDKIMSNLRAALDGTEQDAV
jgi:MarR family transcriptional regulator, organic hydroperoxide resistance regulator